MELAQKDQLLEISPGARLGLPIMCGRLSVSPRQTRAVGAQSAKGRNLSGIALGPWSPNKSSLYDVMQNKRKAFAFHKPFMRMTGHPLDTSAAILRIAR
jgi:hypothetical protein